MISVIIPARNEPYLQNTINDLLLRSNKEVEIIVVLDGYWPQPPLENHAQVTLIHNTNPMGMRSAINAAARISKGKYLLKCDAHCAFDKGYDVKLIADCKKNWTVVPVRYSLDTNKWKPKLDKKYEFEFISHEDLKGKKWPEYANRVDGNELPDLMTFQGSCWFMHRDRFFELGCLDEENYGSMGREAQEVCLKSWLSGGKCILNRKTWYAHWNKGKKDVQFSSKDEKKKSTVFAVELWENNKWEGQTKDIQWLVDHFAPVPTWENFQPEQKESKQMASKSKSYRQESGWHVKKTQQKKATDLKPKEYLKNNYELVNKNKDILVKGLTRAGLYEFFAALGYTRGAEIGVQRGRNAQVILDNMNINLLYLVEPYADHPSNHRAWGNKVHQKFKKQAHTRLAGQPVIWLEDFSENIAHMVPDNFLDFVYIDGEHTYDYCMIDIILWNRKVKRGGIISGHDYEYWKPKQPKVARAINDYADVSNARPIYLTDKTVKVNPGDGSASWFWVKP